MSKITPSLLNDTLNLVQLARETARMQGHQSKADRLQPVVEGLRDIVANAQTSELGGSNGAVSQSDFQVLLKVIQKDNSAAGPGSGDKGSSHAERSQILAALSSGGMTDIEIARQMGITRDEVRTVLSLEQRRAYAEEVKK